METIQPGQFEDQVYAAVKRAFSSVIAAHPGEAFYAFGLFTDDSLQFLHPIANTEEALAETVARYREKVDPKYGCTSTRAGLRWSYGDWGYFPDVGGDSFREINEALRLRFDRMIDDEGSDGDSRLLWVAILRGFQRVEAEGLFGAGTARDRITLLLCGDLPGDLVNAWVSALNPSVVAERFVSWDYGAADEGQGAVPLSGTGLQRREFGSLERMEGA